MPSATRTLDGAAPPACKPSWIWRCDSWVPPASNVVTVRLAYAAGSPYIRIVPDSVRAHGASSKSMVTARVLLGQQVPLHGRVGVCPLQRLHLHALPRWHRRAAPAMPRHRRPPAGRPARRPALPAGTVALPARTATSRLHSTLFTCGGTAHLQGDRCAHDVETSLRQVAGEAGDGEPLCSKGRVPT